MKILEIKDKIGNWQIFKDKIYFIKDSSIFRLNDEIPIIELNDNYWGVIFKNDFFNVFTIESLNTFYDYNGNQLKFLEETFIYDIISQKEFLYRDIIENKIFFSDDFVCFGKIVNSHIYKK